MIVLWAIYGPEGSDVLLVALGKKWVVKIFLPLWGYTEWTFAEQDGYSIRKVEVREVKE